MESSTDSDIDTSFVSNYELKYQDEISNILGQKSVLYSKYDEITEEIDRFFSKKRLTVVPIERTKDDIRSLVWNVHQLNDDSPSTVVQDVAEVILTGEFDLVCLVEAGGKEKGKRIWNELGDFMGKEFTVAYEYQTVCITKNETFPVEDLSNARLLKFPLDKVVENGIFQRQFGGVGTTAQEKLKRTKEAFKDFNFTHPQVVWPMKHKSGVPFTPVAVHLKASGNCNKRLEELGWTDDLVRSAEFFGLGSSAINEVNPLLMGDFNVGLKVADRLNSWLNNPRTLPQRIKKANVYSLKELMVEELKAKLKVSIAGFIPLGSNTTFDEPTVMITSTMVDPRKQKIHDFFLGPSYFEDDEAGIISPDPQQSELLWFGSYTCVKQSFLLRNRISTYTDHWPVWCQFSSKPLVKDKLFDVQEKPKSKSSKK